MTTFTFHAPATIVCEPGVAKRLGPRVKERLGARVILITDPGLVDAGLVEPVRAGLAEDGVSVTVFADVTPDPPEAVVLAALARAEEADVTGVIGLGGGSSMDVAKLAALLRGGGEALADVYGVGVARGPRLPLAQIPTTAGTGSEATPVAIVTTGDGVKTGVVTPITVPDFAILDAELTLGLPPAVTAATGYDAMVHAIEAHTSTAANNNPVSAVLAREALRLLGRSLEAAVADGRSNLAARSDVLLGACLAGMAFCNAPVSATHALAYPIGGRYHVPHGVSIALLLPHVLAFNVSACGEAYQALAGDVFPPLGAAPPGERAGAFITGMATLRERIGLPTRLSDVGVAHADIPDLAAEAMLHTRLLVNNPRPVTQADAADVYTAAF